MPDQKLLQRISKLQAMADRGTRTEAVVAAGKISSLLLKHNLSLADLENIQRQTMTETDLEVGHEQWTGPLAAAVARAHLSGVIASIEPEKPTIFRFIGREDNVAVAIRIFEWLHERVLWLSALALSEQRDAGDWYVFIDPGGWHRAWQCGMVDGIIEAFHRARTDLTESESLALVPIDQEVHDHIAQQYPDAKPPTIKDEIDAAAYRAGFAEGIRTPLETQIEDDDAEALATGY